MRPNELVAKWSARAEAYRLGHARVDASALCEDFVRDLQHVELVTDDERVTLAEGAQLSGYSVQHLRRLIQRGRLEATRQGKALLVERRSLPRKARALASSLPMPHLLGAKAEQVVRERVGASNGTPR